MRPFDRKDGGCVLCGRSRKEIRKLILGVHGGVCLECVREVIRDHPEQRAEASGSRCVLCGKTLEQVKTLISRVHGGICLECVDLCQEIIASDTAEQAQK